MNISDLFSIARQRFPTKTAIEYGSPEGEVAWTYEELHRAAERLAAGLRAWGLQRGDRVAFFLGNRPEFVIAYLAVLRLGAVMTPVNLRYRRGEIRHILSDCTPRLIITERQYEAQLMEAGCGESSVEALVYAEELRQWESDAVDAPQPAIQGSELAFIMYTSGTTGQSKGAMITHNNVLANVTALCAAWAWEPADTLLLCLPLFHVHGLVVGLHCALASGATVMLRERYQAGQTLAELVGGRPTIFFGVPTIYVRLVDEIEQMPSLELHHMRLFCSGSAPLAAETFDTFQRLTGHAILERYGMTETGMNLSNPYVGRREPGSVGTPLPGVEIRIIDHSVRALPSGSEGELLVRGSNVFGGYWNAPEKTAESFSHDEAGRQWFHTGDLARQDPETGYITLLGRRHELIISGGFNIYPREVEETLSTYPGVREAAVVGVPDREWGEVPVAYVVCDSPVSDEELTAHCRKELAGFKTPRRFYRVQALPRNAMGKLQKHLLDRSPQG